MAIGVKNKNMTQLKQRTVKDVLVQLLRFSTDEPGKQFEYQIEENGRKVPGPGGQKIFRKDVAKEHFNRTVRKIKQGNRPGKKNRGVMMGRRASVAGGRTADDTLGNT